MTFVMENLAKRIPFTLKDLEYNRQGKMTPEQKKRLKEETSGAVKDLFYIAIFFPTLLIIVSSIILVVWLLIHSPDILPEVIGIACIISIVFYIVRKVLLKDLWDSEAVLKYKWDKNSIGLIEKNKQVLDEDPGSRNDSSNLREDFYSNESPFPFHIPESIENDLKNIENAIIYYNPTHKKILSIDLV